MDGRSLYVFARAARHLFLLALAADAAVARDRYSFHHRQPRRSGLEILENTPLVIDRYRVATASLEYYGDSILNSTFDLIAAMIGFWLAWRYDWKWVLLFVVAIELLLAYFISDNLTLNILMLFYPLESIKQWQLAR